MIYVILAVIVGLLMKVSGMPWLPIIEGFAIFAPAYLLLCSSGRYYSISFLIQSVGMGAFVSFTLFDKGLMYSWGRLSLIFLLSISMGFLGRWLISRNLRKTMPPK